MKEYIIAKRYDMHDGEMKELSAGDTQITLAREGGRFYAFGANCPHHGAPLAKGFLAGPHVRCPWHMSVFDIESGQMIQPPTLDNVPAFQVRVDGEDVIATLPDQPPGSVVPPMAAQNQRDDRNFVIVGTGAAGLSAAEALRQAGYGGRIIMLTGEKVMPYDRTELSKRYLALAKAPDTFIRSAEFYDANGIQILSGREVQSVDTRLKEIVFADRSAFNYDSLLLATGGVPRSLGVPGGNLQNVFLLRSCENANAIRAAIERSKRAVIVGAGFIGMETAAALAQRGIEVTVVAPQDTPLERQFGPEIGLMYKRLHEQNGVKFLMKNTVDRFEGDKALRSAVLADGQIINVDMAIIGIGVEPRAEYVSGLPIARDGSIVVDSHMRAAPGVFAAGDIATFPDWRTGQPVRIEHWRLAMQLGRTAAMNMAGQDVEYEGVPFFWTFQYKVVVQYIGYASDWDEIVFDGNTEDMKFIAYYLKDGRVMAAAGCGRNYEICRLAELMRAVAMTVAHVLFFIFAAILLILIVLLILGISTWS